jgi:hypothetical protein
VDQFAEGKNVGPRIHLFAFQLLGSHVLKRTDDQALTGQLRLIHGHLGEGSVGQRSHARLLGQSPSAWRRS